MHHLLIVLVLFSALLHAAWNAFLHISEDRVIQLGTMAVPYIVVGMAGALWLPAPAAAAWPYIGTSAVLELGYCTVLLRAYRSGEFSQIYPIARGSSPLLVALFTLVTLGEQPSAAGLAGIVLVSTGIMSLALRRGFRLSGESVPYAILTGVFIATYTVVDGIGVRLAGNALSYISWVYLLWNAPQFALVCALRGGLRPFVTRHAAPWRGIGAGTCSLAAYAIVTIAYRHLPIATVSALRETSSIFAIGIGWLVMREPPNMRRLAVCALVVAGAVLIRM